MRRLAKTLVLLYPRAWRERYGHELECLLEDTGNGWRHIPDILMEACRMRSQTLNWRVALLFALSGLVVATGVSFRLPDRYTSTSEVVFDPAPNTPPEAKRNELDRLRRDILSRVSLSNLISTPGANLYKDQLRRMPLSEVAAAMRDTDLQVETVAVPSPGIRITYAYSNPALASATVQRLTQRVLDEHNNRRRKVIQLAANQKIDSSLVGTLVIDAPARIVAPPALPPTPLRSSHLQSAIAGLILGAVFWVWLSFIRQLPRFAIRTAIFLLLVVAASWAVPFPYYSKAVLAVDSPETLHRLLADKALQSVLSTVTVEAEGPAAIAITARDTNRNDLAQRKAQEFIASFINLANSIYPPWENSLLYPAGHWVDVVDSPSLPFMYSGANWRGATAAIGLLTLFAGLAFRRTRTTLQPA